MARSGSRSRAQVWEFNIVGIYDGDAGVDKTQFFFRYDYLDENRRQGDGLVGWYIVKIADPSQAQEMGAKFDEMFANSSAETKTTTEKGFVEGFAKQVGDIGAIMIAILVAVLFTMLLVAANTMAQSVRERTSEVGVLKTLGFSNGSILALVLGESVLIAVIGGGLGLLGRLADRAAGRSRPAGMLPIFVLPGARRRRRRGADRRRWASWPACCRRVSAMQLKITDALRTRADAEETRVQLDCVRRSPSRRSTCGPSRSGWARRASPSSASPASSSCSCRCSRSPPASRRRCAAPDRRPARS